MERRERGAESHGATGEEYVLGAGEERLELRLTPAGEPGNEEENGRFMEVFRQVERGLAAPSLDRVRDAPLGAIAP